MTGSVTQVSTDGAATWGRRDTDVAYISVIQEILIKWAKLLERFFNYTHTHMHRICDDVSYVLSILSSAKVCIPLGLLHGKKMETVHMCILQINTFSRRKGEVWMRPKTIQQSKTKSNEQKKFNIKYYIQEVRRTFELI